MNICILDLKPESSQLCPEICSLFTLKTSLIALSVEARFNFYKVNEDKKIWIYIDAYT